MQMNFVAVNDENQAAYEKVITAKAETNSGNVI